MIVNQSSANALLGFSTNAAAGEFTLSGNAGLTTTGGSFSNAGLFTVSTGSTFKVGGSSFNFTQTAGTTTVDGTMASAGAGSLSLNGGMLFGTGTVNYGVVDRRSPVMRKAVNWPAGLPPSLWTRLGARASRPAPVSTRPVLVAGSTLARSR